MNGAGSGMMGHWCHLVLPGLVCRAVDIAGAGRLDVVVPPARINLDSKRRLVGQHVRQYALEHRHEALEDGRDRRVERTVSRRVQVVDVPECCDFASLGDGKVGREPLILLRGDVGNTPTRVWF